MGDDDGAMRTADESQPSEGGAASAELGDGFKASVSADDLSGGFGDELDDDYGDSSSGDEGPDGSDSTDTSGDGASGSDGSSAEGQISDLSESEAEDALVDMIEDQGFTTDEAQGIVDDVQADTGMTATELLETYSDSDQSEPASDGSMGFDGSDLSGIGQPDPLAEDDPFDALGLSGDSDLDLDHDGRVTQADADEAHSAFDFDLGG